MQAQESQPLPRENSVTKSGQVSDDNSRVSQFDFVGALIG